MTESKELQQFNKYHPWPDEYQIQSLFRFYSIDLGLVERLKQLFIDCKLYHSLPTQFNDPFECRPHFTWPKKATGVREIRLHLIKGFREKGFSKNDAEAVVSERMKTPNFMYETISNAITGTFSEFRICSFTTQKENLLFWSHYADSHRGFCVEFNTTIMPVSYAYKVRYMEKYPTVFYPRPNDARALIPALVKSKVWEYENEFRTIFVPDAIDQPENDGESLILRGNQIKNVYLGADIGENERGFMLDLIEQSQFNPGIWSAQLSKSNFSLDFSRVN